MNKIIPALALGLAQMSSFAQANVEDATAYTHLNTQSISANTGSYLQNYEFGTHVLNNAEATVGSNSSGTPIVQFSAASANTTVEQSGVISTQLTYSWKVSGEGNSPVLVHISTSGWLSGNYGIVMQNGYTPTPGYLTGYTYVSFNSAVQNGSGIQNYGLQTGGVNLGLTSIAPVEGYGQSSQSFSGSFHEEFDLLVNPNVINFISMYGAGSLSTSSQFTHKFGTEHFSISGYIDPVITIDSAYANQYTLEVSNIPVVTSVPEPETYAMLIAGLGLIGGIARGRCRAK